MGAEVSTRKRASFGDHRLQSLVGKGDIEGQDAAVSRTRPGWSHARGCSRVARLPPSGRSGTASRRSGHGPRPPRARARRSGHGPRLPRARARRSGHGPRPPRARPRRFGHGPRPPRGEAEALRSRTMAASGKAEALRSRTTAAPGEAGRSGHALSPPWAREIDGPPNLDADACEPVLLKRGRLLGCGGPPNLDADACEAVLLKRGRLLVPGGPPNLDADTGEAVLLKRGGRSAIGLESPLPNTNENISNLKGPTLAFSRGRRILHAEAGKIR